jgi:hypothetical protein
VRLPFRCRSRRQVSVTACGAETMTRKTRGRSGQDDF